MARGVRLAFLLTVPCAIGLICLAEPIISMLFQRGKFTFESTIQCAAALRFYAIGLVAYSGIKVLAPAFYALDRRNLPMMVSFLSIATNYFLNQLFTFHLQYGHRGLALSTSIVAVINFAILYGMMIRQTDGLESDALLENVAKLAVAAIPMTLVCLGAQHWFFAHLDRMLFLPKVIGVVGTVSLAAALFGGMTALLRIDEVEDVVALVKRKLRKGRG